MMMHLPDYVKKRIGSIVKPFMQSALHQGVTSNEDKRIASKSGPSQGPEYVFGQNRQFSNQDGNITVFASIPPAIYRFVLSDKATPAQRQNFETNLQSFRQQGWSVMPDPPRRHERLAFIVMPNNQDYAAQRASYVASTALNKAFAGGYDAR